MWSLKLLPLCSDGFVEQLPLLGAVFHAGDMELLSCSSSNLVGVYDSWDLSFPVIPPALELLFSSCSSSGLRPAFSEDI